MSGTGKVLNHEEFPAIQEGLKIVKAGKTAWKHFKFSVVSKSRDGLSKPDRLSELPDSIIDIILSYVRSPKEIVRTKILSKRWRQRPCKIPIISFDEGHESMWPFKCNVDRIIKSLHRNKVSIKKFQLLIRSSGWDPDRIVDRWMKMAIGSSVEEIDLTNNGEGSLSFPPSILAAKSLKSLTIWRFAFPDELFGIPTSLSCLKRLDLGHANDHMLHYIISHTPMLEELFLRYSKGVGKLQLTNLHYLKYVYILQTTPQTIYEVEAPRLERLYLDMHSFGNFGITAMENLRFLGITTCFSPVLESLLSAVIPKLPVLDTLFLSSLIRKLEIHSRSIRVIVLDLRGSPESVKIDAPNVCRFYYKSDMLLKDFGPKHSPGRWEACLDDNLSHPDGSPWDPPVPRDPLEKYFRPDLIRSPWFVKLRAILSNPSPFRFFYIRCGCRFTTGNEIGFEDFEDANLLHRVSELEHLKLDVVASCPSSFSAVVASLFWNCRPKFLSLSSNRVEHAEFFCRAMKAAAVGFCGRGCDSGGFKCWRHYLKGVKEISYREIEGVEPFRSCCQYPDYAYVFEDHHKYFCLKLDWRWD